MNYLNRMYGGGNPAPESSKNANRVLGGLRGQGVDHYSILGEDGIERSVPTQRYVQALEEKIRIQDAKIAAQDAKFSVIEKRLRSLTNDQRIINSNQRVVNQSFKRTDDL